jgi:hypothetical protein
MVPYSKWLESSITLLSQPHVSHMYYSAYFSNAFYGTLRSAQLITAKKYYNQQVNILYFFLYMLHIKVTHWIYSFMMCFLFTYYIYLIYFICLFIYLFVYVFVCSTGLLHNSLHNSPEVRSSNLLPCGCLKSRGVCVCARARVCVCARARACVSHTPFYVTAILASCKANSTMDNMKPN